MKLVRHLDQKDRETDGALQWKSMGPKLRHAFQERGGRTFSDSQWLEYIYKGGNRPRFQYCKNFNDVLLSIRPIQGHTGGKWIACELMSHVAIALRCKERDVKLLSKTDRRWKGQERRATDSTLHTIRLFG